VGTKMDKIGNWQWAIRNSAWNFLYFAGFRYPS